MKPLKDNVFVIETEDKSERTTDSGIILSGEIDMGSRIGVVAAIGPDVESVKEGEYVAVDWNKGLKVSHDGVNGSLVPEEAIKGVY